MSLAHRVTQIRKDCEFFLFDYFRILRERLWNRMCQYCVGGILTEKRNCMNHLPAKTDHWTRQFDQSPKALDTRVFQITKLASSPDEGDLIIAMTSKQSAQRLIAAFAERGGSGRYRVSCFEHPFLPGFQSMEMEH